MTTALKFLGIAGSLRKDSYNRSALLAAQNLVPDNVTLDIFDLEGIPLYNQDYESQPVPRLVEFKTAIRAADAIVFSTPEYNYSIPGVLKNAIDCACRPYGDSAWEAKPAAILGASVSVFGSARGQYHLRQTLVALHMLVLNEPEVMIGNADKGETVFNRYGKLVDATAIELIRQLLSDLAIWTRRLKLPL